MADATRFRGPFRLRVPARTTHQRSCDGHLLTPHADQPDQRGGPGPVAPERAAKACGVCHPEGRMSPAPGSLGPKRKKSGRGAAAHHPRTVNLSVSRPVSPGRRWRMSSSTDLMIELHSDHARALWGFALRLTGGDRAHAEDVVQETLLRAWRDRRILQSTTAGTRAWLFTVARRPGSRAGNGWTATRRSPAAGQR